MDSPRLPIDWLVFFVVRHNPLFEPLPILYDHVVNNLSAEDTSPPPKTFLVTEKLFMGHGSTTAIAIHYMKPVIEFERSLSRQSYQVNKN